MMDGRKQRQSKRDLELLILELEGFHGLDKELLTKPFLGRCVQRFYLSTLGYSTIHIFASEHKNFHDPSFK